ncbi:helix-turn-helix domain-containing protein [Tangfeifania diversioriginum]|nr:helix-turn-helix transcriptional regulator [Tangfeifania diversioriginum]
MMSKISEIISNQEHKCFVFKPSPEFYAHVGINNRRWAQIYRGQVEPTLSEAKAIADYFEIEVTELF